MSNHKNEITELRLWAKDDIVPTDLQGLCKVAANSIKALRAENEQLKKRYSISSFQRELATQCIDFVKNSSKSYGSIPLGHNLAEDIGIIRQAEQELKGK